MTIIWKPNQRQRGVDELGNCYQINANLKTVTCKTPDGFIGCSWTAEDAKKAALTNKEEARKSYIEQPIILDIPGHLKADDLEYWSNRTSTLLNHSNIQFVVIL